MAHAMHVPEITTKSDNGSAGTFVIEPLHRGFGITLGNALRRVLLSSLEGAAATAFKVEGVSHEFSTLPGITEDLVQITLNLKQLRFKSFSDEPQMVEINKKGKGEVTAKDIKTTPDVEVVSVGQHIATLDNPKASLVMSLRVEKGRGYMPVEEHAEDQLAVGMIGLDALFTPVKRVRYKVEHTRVGQVTDLDKLTLDVTTDGSVSPTDALRQAAGILMNQFSVISGEEPPAKVAATDEGGDSSDPNELNFSIDDLNLSPRTSNALMNNGITTVRELMDVNDSQLRELKGFGAKAYNELVSKLKELELR